MAVFIDAPNIGRAWLSAFEALQSTGNAVNISVAITDPLREDLGVRRAIEARLVSLRASGHRDFQGVQSMHTVANTIFPVGLYRPETHDAATRFLANVGRNERLRAHSRHRGWGTYIGRLTAYPARDGGTTNQLQQVLKTLNAPRNYQDRYEMPISAPGQDPQEHADPGGVTAGALLHGDTRCDALARGGPCLAHLSLTSRDGALSMVALYRRHEYEARAYGNFLGLARLLAFLASESGRRVGELLVVTGHAVATDAPGRHSLLEAAQQSAGTVTSIETSARPLGARLRDLDLPRAPR